MKSTYQVVIKLSEDERIIFAGVTQDSITNVIHSCNSMLKDGLDSIVFNKSICENLIYQPFKEVKNETQTQK